MKDQYVVYSRINKRGKAYYIVFDNIAQRGVMGKGNYYNEAAAKAEAKRMNDIARARVGDQLKRGKYGSKVVLFESEFDRMKAAVEENEDLRITAAEGKQASKDLEDLRHNLPEIVSKAANDAAAKAVQAVSEQYDRVLKVVVDEKNKVEKENAALLKENRALKDFIKNNL